MRVLSFVVLATLLGAVGSCTKPTPLTAHTRRFVPFKDELNAKVKGDAVIAAPLRAPIVDLTGAPRDVVMLRTSEKSVLIFHNDGAGVLTVTEGRTIKLEGEPVAVVAADFDDDGAADLAVACRMSNSVQFLMNTGAGEFTIDTAREITLPGVPVGLVAQQFDHEGDDNGADVPEGAGIDLAVAVNIADEGGAVLVFHNNGTRLDLARIIDTDRSSNDLDPIDDIDSGDVENDKDIDIIIAAGRKSNSSARVLLNMGRAGGWEFSAGQRFPVKDSIGPLVVLRVRCVDLYRDGVAPDGQPFPELLISAQRDGFPPTRSNWVAGNREREVVENQWLEFDEPEFLADLAGAEVATGVLDNTTPRNRWLDIVAFRGSTYGDLQVFRNKSNTTPGAPVLKLTAEPSKTTSDGKGARISELNGAAGAEILSNSGYYYVVPD